MILESVFSVILDLVEFFLGFIDLTPFSLPSWGINFTNLLLKGLSFFPFEIWSIVLSNILFWVVIHFTWAIIEWIYVKIPGVN